MNSSGIIILLPFSKPFCTPLATIQSVKNINAALNKIIFSGLFIKFDQLLITLCVVALLNAPETVKKK
jgi:hypothetical protein